MTPIKNIKSPTAEAVVRSSSVEKVLLKILQNSEENNCKIRLKNKLYNKLKNRLQHSSGFL